MGRPFSCGRSRRGFAHYCGRSLGSRSAAPDCSTTPRPVAHTPASPDRRCCRCAGPARSRRPRGCARAWPGRPRHRRGRFHPVLRELAHVGVGRRRSGVHRAAHVGDQRRPVVHLPAVVRAHAFHLRREEVALEDHQPRVDQRLLDEALPGRRDAVALAQFRLVVLHGLQAGDEARVVPGAPLHRFHPLQRQRMRMRRLGRDAPIHRGLYLTDQRMPVRQHVRVVAQRQVLQFLRWVP